MLTDNDIQKLIDVFPTREEVVEKEEFESFKGEVKQGFSDMLTAVDNLVNQTEKYHQEMKMFGYKVDRHEKWILQLAEKIGIKLEY